MVTNQSGIARGLITEADVWAVAGELERQVGRFDVWCVCPHGPGDSCPCRKPRPGLILAAAGALGLEPGRCVVIGDRPTDVEAATSAGAHGLLLPARSASGVTVIELAVARALAHEPPVAHRAEDGHVHP